MAIVNTEAFVLKSFKYGETSKIVTLFTKDYGKLNVIVKGARNFKSRLCGTLESMNYINAIFYLRQNRELQLLTNAEYKNSFQNILNDFSKLETAFRIIDIVNKSVIEYQANHSLFELLIETYSRLNDSSKNFDHYILYFQIELTKIFGLDPDSFKSTEKKETFFANNEFYVDKSLMKYLDLIGENEIDKIEFLDIEVKSLKSLINSYEKYLSAHTHGFKFYNSSKVFQELNQFN